MLNESPFFDPESGEQYDAIVVDKFSFLLPCKAFSIKYTISKGYDLAITYEFILRFLQINGPTEIDILRKYFGFSSQEIAIELNKLINEGYIEKNVHTNEIKLTSQGIGLFIDEKPEIIKTENVTGKFSVELISYNFVKSQKSSHINAFISMNMTQAEAQAASNSKAKAKSSFVNSFHQFTESNYGKEDGFRRNLRKIDNITALYSFPAEIQANMELKISP
jgi:DNA-binding Lrp family transcriptional regulator